jgi:hypothetical protein
MVALPVGPRCLLLRQWRGTAQEDEHFVAAGGDKTHLISARRPRPVTVLR